jgi:hypothetical protein
MTKLDKLVKISKQEAERAYVVVLEKIQKDKISHAKRGKK